ncbi:MarP family serine protease [Georgenia sp. MJ173]|uniref:MarP family serine protease n=1 Tax=Georgenia sunbinii TaxID=3117728 RepID=UPI002F262795
MVIDLLLAVVLLAALLGGLRRGLVATVAGLTGLLAGAVAAFWLVPLVNDMLPSSAWRGPTVIVVALLLPLLGASVGTGIGNVLRRGAERTPMRLLDRILGGGVTVVVGAIVLSFAGSAIVATGVPVVAPAIASSSVLRTIDRLTPAPVGRTLAELRAMVLDEGLPAVGDLLVPVLRPSLPEVDLDDPALAQAARSVARISGTAYACGISSTGSGFVIAEDRLVTNAHVVAGVDRPIVELPGQRAREGEVVYFDPVVDLAVVAVDDAGAVPLPIAPTLAVASPAIIQGFPHGGPFTSGSAQVLEVETVPVSGLGGQEGADREIYALAAQVRPGNSGGPLLTTDGAAAGVIFARAESDPDLGYAMTTTELLPVVALAPDLDTAVPAGECTR